MNDEFALGTNTDSRKQHFRVQRTSGWATLNLRELWTYRDLFWILVGRDVQLRYKQTFLGVAWVILQPLLTSVIFAVIFGVLADLPSDGVPYFLFAFAGSFTHRRHQILTRISTGPVSG